MDTQAGKDEGKVLNRREQARSFVEKDGRRRRGSVGACKASGEERPREYLNLHVSAALVWVARKSRPICDLPQSRASCASATPPPIPSGKQSRYYE